MCSLNRSIRANDKPEQVPVILALEHRSERRNGVRLPE